MREVIGFLIKGMTKNKYVYLLPLVIILVATSLLVINSTQPSSTQKELLELFEKRKESLDFLIGKTLNKKRHIGLPENQQLALDSLLVQEEYVKRIVQTLTDSDLNIVNDNLAYIDEYMDYRNYKFIPYENEDLLEIERGKARSLVAHSLPFTEQETPFQTALFTKQLSLLLFNPLTALLFLLIFSYKYSTDAQNRTFDFLKMNSLASPSIYYGYVISFLLFMISYVLFSVILAFLPPLVTGNLNTVFYPVEVVVGGETKMVPVWKWLLFLPIGWGMLVSLLLIAASWLCKQRVSLGVLAGFLLLPLLALYIAADQFGFSMANPIHLVVAYDANLLPSYRFVTYLVGMLLLLMVCAGISYPIFHSKGTVFRRRGGKDDRKPYQPWSKWKFFQFEHLKKRREGRVLFTLLLLLGICVGTSIFVNQQYRTIDEKAVKTIEELQGVFVSSLVNIKVLEEDHEVEHPTLDNPYSKWVEILENDIARLEELKKKAGSQAFLDLYREVLLAVGSSTADSYKEMTTNFWNVTTMASEEQQILLKEKGIRPWDIGNLWISNFNDPKTALSNEHYELLKMSQEGNEKYGNSALFTAFSYMNWNLAWIVLGVFVFVLWTSMAEEQRPNRSIHFLATKPLRLRSVYVSKWAYNLAAACLFFVFSGMIAFFVSSLLGGIGEADYPILTYAVSENDMGEGQFYSPVDKAYFSFDSLLGMLLKSVVLIVAQIFFLNSLFSLIGRWLKNQYVVIIATLIITVGGYLVTSYPSASVMSLNPFLYFDTWHVVDGWKSILTESSLVSTGMGCIVLFTSGLLLFIIGLLPNKKGVS
ncbi:ABC transporter permease [Sporosarcina sp. Te-1]|uniref:ABC transporter permease n=1 Tax=Sporosarcina sp. Te-1 TaxID=2818390 RepID=UPI001A9F84CE|nr:hypothetical protein [Sporosarcina sp. Te-1]QTD42774.1 hypothetical protein J3U78_08410 [Sporosarcina sp. Te-1]